MSVWVDIHKHSNGDVERKEDQRSASDFFMKLPKIDQSSFKAMLKGGQEIDLNKVKTIKSI